MKDVMVIEDVSTQRIEYKGQIVVTLSTVDRIHKKADGSARKTFTRNQDNFIEGFDYFVLSYAEWSVLVETSSPDQTDFVPTKEAGKGGHRGNMTFLTMMGYVQLASRLSDEQSDHVLRAMKTRYFNLAQMLSDAREIEHLKTKAAECDALKDRVISLQSDIINDKKQIIDLASWKRKLGRGLSVEERATILELHNQGEANAVIARQINRSESAISNFLKYRNTSGRIKQPLA